MTETTSQQYTKETDPNDHSERSSVFQPWKLRDFRKGPDVERKKLAMDEAAADMRTGTGWTDDFDDRWGPSLHTGHFTGEAMSSSSPGSTTLDEKSTRTKSTALMPVWLQQIVPGWKSKSSEEN
ncbi:uncharacterized protein I206_105136 [Kwoniella pini CBS 10737]|uniref:Uncharacterized protein n=1 Tax=Kwoniella pini CBS 10737 TaxID=1296096 RepID=A0A1B9I969_9TREE|nr:uncharacterized protein I206_02678 [Kwoniella pini CBS 10737]OCF51961.1 hypothetical protein I206_02678 [Kwoniella pini CBS 10737]